MSRHDSKKHRRAGFFNQDTESSTMSHILVHLIPHVIATSYKASL